MNNLRDQALTLRKSGKSYNDIVKSLGIAKSTLAYWLAHERLPEKTKLLLLKRAQKSKIKRLRLMAEANKKRWVLTHERYQREAKVTFRLQKKDLLFISGICLYWGEGDKRLSNSVVRLSNVDLRLLQVFLRFLKDSLCIPPNKLRAWVLLYEGMEEQSCKTYWSHGLRLPLSQFLKSQVIKSRSSRRTTAYGVCTLQINSSELKRKLLAWINECSTMLQHAGIV